MTSSPDAMLLTYNAIGEVTAIDNGADGTPDVTMYYGPQGNSTGHKAGAVTTSSTYDFQMRVSVRPSAFLN